MKKLFLTIVLCIATAALGMSLTACNKIKEKFAMVAETPETKAVDTEQSVQKSLDLKASELMDLYIEWKGSAWEALTKRIGWTCDGKDMQYDADQVLDLYTRGIDYNVETYKFKKTADDGIGLAMISHEVDGEAWELLLASKADYDALMAGMASEKEYKVDQNMQQMYDESPDLHADKVFLKAVYDEELSKMAGQRLGNPYYITFEGERDGLYIVSFSHGNGDVEME